MLLTNGRYCDHVKQRKPGAVEKNCNRRASHTIDTKYGTLDYCNKCLPAGKNQLLNSAN